MIVYFSGTGNSYYVAKSLAGIGDRLIDVMVEPAQPLVDERIGIVFPCYCNDAPKELIEFLQKSEIKANYIYAIATCGASAGNSFHSIQYVLQSKGQRLAYAKSIVMPDSCVMLAFSPDVVKRLLDKQDDKISAVKKAVFASETIKIKAKKPHGLFTRMVWSAFKNIVGIKKKKSDEELCINCGECVKACKLNNISVSDNKVTFGNNCCYCFACINSCPTNAISFGKVKATDEKRYKHPIYKN